VTAISNPIQISSARRFVLLFGFGSVIAASWAYLALMIRDMSAMPMVHGFARMKASERGRPSLVLPVALFGGGYVAAWSAFGVAAAILQAGLTGAAILSPMSMKVSGSDLAGGILILAGVYQWMPLKQACLRRCRTPFGFLTTEWREGQLGPLVMGWRHGLFCIGCCWALMCVLFTAGVMNPIGIVGIAAYVLVEKVAPHGETMTRLIGVGLIIGGLGMALGGG